MQAREVQGNAIAYNASLSSLEKSTSKRWRGWRLAANLCEALTRRTIAPTVITCSAMISALEKGLQWQRAGKLLEQLVQLQVEANVISFNAAVTACASAQKALDDRRGSAMTTDV
ncbi:unnamed protein product [Durusdinium trenchii]